MKNKNDYDELLKVINEECRIHASYPNLKGGQKEIADIRLKYISDFKQTFSQYEISCIDEMLKPVVDRKKIEELIRNQIAVKSEKKKALERMNTIIANEDKLRKFKIEQEEAAFIAWFLTAMIKQKAFFYDDLDAVILYEVLKSFLSPDRPSLSI